MRRKIVGGTVFLMILIVGVGFLKMENTPEVDQLILKTLTAEKIALNQLNQPVVVTFWATNCPSCLKEIPLLTQLHQQYYSQGVKIIAIAMSYNPPNRVVEMVKSKQIPYSVVLDLQGTYAEAFGNIQVIPTTFLISASGKIVSKKIGLFSFKSMQQHIEHLLKG